MKTVALVVQRDLLGSIAEYLIVLAEGERRTSLATVEGFSAAQAEARQVAREHRAARISLEVGNE